MFAVRRFKTRFSIGFAVLLLIMLSPLLSLVTAVQNEDPFSLETVLYMGTVSDDGDMNTLLTLFRRFPDSSPIQATSRMLFDADNDAQTGQVISGFTGIDREVRIEFTKSAPEAQAVATGTILHHLKEGEPTSLPQPLQVLPALSFPCSTCPNYENQIIFKVRKASLNLTAPNPPFYAILQEADGVMAGIFMIFDSSRTEAPPRLTLFQPKVYPGQMVPFIVSGLQADSPFEVFVGQDQPPILSETLDSTGSYAGGFVFPDLPPGGYFVTVRDSTGKVAFMQVEVPGPDEGEPQ